MNRHQFECDTFCKYYDEIEEAQDKHGVAEVLLKLFKEEHSHDRDVLMDFAIAKEKMLHFLTWKKEGRSL